MSYIDSITHVTPDGDWFSLPYDAGIHTLLRQMDKSNVEKAVVVAIADYIENDWVIKICSQYRERLIPCLSINPVKYQTFDDLSSAFINLQKYDFHLIKLHPRLNHYDPLSRNSLDLLKLIESSGRKYIVWLDTLFHKRGLFLKKGTVETIHDLVNLFPTLKFVLLHGGGSYLLSVCQAIRDCPNALVDLSLTALKFRYSSLKHDIYQLMNNFDRRLVFGSDFPEFSLIESFRVIEEIAGDTSQEKLNNILSENMKNFLRI